MIREPQSLYRQHGGNDHLTVSFDESLQRQRAFYDHYANRLERNGVQMGIEVDAHEWRNHSWVHLHDLMVLDIAGLPGRTRSVILIDDGWYTAATIGGRRRIAFMQQQGTNSGPPADDEAAILHVELLRAKGAGLLVVAWVSFWWREHYKGLFAYLEARYPKLLDNARCLAFDLPQDKPLLHMSTEL